MSNLFIVLAKLLGVYLAFHAATYVAWAFTLGGDGAAPLLVQLLGAAIGFAFAFLLLFRTDRLAHRVRAPSSPYSRSTPRSCSAPALSSSAST